MMSDDMALVREYADRSSEQAFATLVSRHVNLVYSVALRQVRDPDLAKEITQNVFIILARKAKFLTPKSILSGWLCRTARNTSADMMKIQRRRQIREQEAQMQTISNEAEPEVWSQVAPLLDEALNFLGEKEHDAVVLRFLDGLELKRVGATMGISEDAARMRVNRGLAKLREFFTRKGLTLSTTAIAGTVAANSVQAAPIGLAATITVTAISGAAITGATMIAASKTVTMTTLQKVLVVATVAILAGVGIHETRQSTDLRKRLESLQRQQAEQIQELTRDQDDVRSRLASALSEVEAGGRNSSEILRLRNEVTRWRQQSDVLAADAKATKEFQSNLMQFTSNTPLVRTFFTTAMLTPSWNEPIVMGGWKTPSGKRAIVITRASPENDPQQLTIKSCIFEYTEEAAVANGLVQFNANEQGGVKPTVLSPDKFDALRKAAEDKNGIEIVAEQAVTTLSGRHAQVQTVDMHQTPSGEKYSTGPVVDVIPTITSGGQSVQMLISAHLNYPVQFPQR